MQVDYIIVGFGLAGMAMSKELEDHGHSFVVLDNASQVSSRVAAGVFNPVILKRFTPVWNADEQLDNLFPFYTDISKRLGGEYLTFFETLKVFKSIEDQNNWFMACDNPLLEKYMNPKIIKEEVNGIHYFEGFGQVKGTGRVLVTKVLDDYIDYLKNKDQFLEIPFLHDELEINQDTINYKDITAKKIIFAEGYGLKENPFFNHLPLTGTKGEMLFIKAPELKLTQQIKSALFVLPVGDDIYWIGATFNWNDKTLDATEKGKAELLEKLNTMIDVPYQVINQFGGIRPTVKDRRPLVGKHSIHKNLIVFNGMGTRGVMIAPTVAKQLYQYLENNKSLPKEIDIERFKS
ncbi:glycine/D-amino acid oxidase-like deaminating enzyme [Wenyingzhuangia heitensis]|uniref:Glycine/D-amino acid oxidase-like deaminating enzyme n=1 Tax=Wenyingzhuangia heitensis TaxID=1487859 RepID=A0ABX0U8R6_9FLAO|nr:FAD-binding oxidoreductase [Wenyingzhuangia heitensis]NIJ44155.1 glycine/D-amino acid oxidase-like deaminating enzyme [Wenyingzhuangia heitensis]